MASRPRHGAVVSVSPHASRIGRDVLKRGGNAVDAAVAVGFALAVTWPEAGNLGGGGFMMVHRAGSDPVMIDYRETAPATSTEAMFQPGESVHTAKAVGVPGTVRGLGLAHERYGKLRWKELLMPAVNLAETGFRVRLPLARSLNAILNKADGEFDELQRVYSKPKGGPWLIGDRLVQPDLAGTLRQIAKAGPDAFYDGFIAEQIVADMKTGGGLIRQDDLAGYQAKLRTPIHTTFRGFDVYGPAPPSSGGITLAMMLNILENFDLNEHGRYSAQSLHLMIESMRRAFADRAQYLGDADFVDIPNFLISKIYARKRAAEIDPDRSTPSESVAPDIPITAHTSTTHFSIIDGDGMAVSNTTTLEQRYGSRLVVTGAGFLLNNEMGDFNWKRGLTTRKGRIGTDPNLIEPHKRMLSSMTPVIVLRNEKVVLVTGSPGGRTIINTVLCVLLNFLEFEMSPAEAIRAPRLHHQWLPDEVRFEGAADPAYARVLEQLRRMGHHIEPKGRRQGDAHTIHINRDGRISALADRRRDGAAAGY